MPTAKPKDQILASARAADVSGLCPGFLIASNNGRHLERLQWNLAVHRREVIAREALAAIVGGYARPVGFADPAIPSS